MTFQRGTALDFEMAGLRFGRAGTRTCTRGTPGPYMTSLDSQYHNIPVHPFELQGITCFAVVAGFAEVQI